MTINYKAGTTRGSRRNRLGLVGLACSVTAVLIFGSAVAANASDSARSGVSAEEVAASLAAVDSSLVETAVGTSRTATEAASLENGTTGLNIPRNPHDGVALRVGDVSVSLGLPQ